MWLQLTCRVFLKHHMRSVSSMGTISSTIHCHVLFSSSHELTLPFLRGCLFGLNKRRLGSVEKHVEERCLPYPYCYKKSSENHVCMRGYEIVDCKPIGTLSNICTWVHTIIWTWIMVAVWNGEKQCLWQPPTTGYRKNMYTAHMHVQWSCLMCPEGFAL